MQLIPLTRRHRAVPLALALLAAGVFLLFITRVGLFGPEDAPLRSCVFSDLYLDDDEVPLPLTKESVAYRELLGTLDELKQAVTFIANTVAY